jgi:outer membrane protein TolC
MNRLTTSQITVPVFLVLMLGTFGCLLQPSPPQSARGPVSIAATDTMEAPSPPRRRVRIPALLPDEVAPSSVNRDVEHRASEPGQIPPDVVNASLALATFLSEPEEVTQGSASEPNGLEGDRNVPDVLPAPADSNVDELEALERLPQQLTRPAVKFRSTPAEILDPVRAKRRVTPLHLPDVIQSVVDRYPSFLAAQEEFEIQAGKELSAQGEFDLKLKSQTANDPLGFYRNYRQLVKFEQNTWHGGTVYSQYRLGRGEFPAWYGDRQTDKGGEFKVGFIQPLLRDRHIDDRRAELFLAQLRLDQVEPFVQAQLLDFVQSASTAYWAWVAAGQAYMLNRELLLVTGERNQAIKNRVDEEDLPKLQLLQNERLIASRRAKLIEAERKLQQAAIKLSVYLIDSSGQPTPPSPAYLPAAFPQPRRPSGEAFEEDVLLALENRPEPRELSYIRRQAEVERTLGQNQLLPSLNAGIDASKDVGEQASSKGDKTPFELSAGLYFDIPLQRRKAWGKIRSSEAKIQQVALKQRSVANQIRAEVQDALSAMIAAHERFVQARISAELAEKVVALEREVFTAGGGDILAVSIQETAALDAELSVIDALFDFYAAVAKYRAALGLNPLAE